MRKTYPRPSGNQPDVQLIDNLQLFTTSENAWHCGASVSEELSVIFSLLKCTDREMSIYNQIEFYICGKYTNFSICTYWHRMQKYPRVWHTCIQRQKHTDTAHLWKYSLYYMKRTVQS